MKSFIILFFVLAFSAILYGQSDENFTSLREDRLETLSFGIDDEVVTVINAIRNEKDDSYNDELLKILENSGNSKIKLPIFSFFEEQETNLASEYAVSLLKMAIDDYEIDEKILIAAISYNGTIKNPDSAEYLAALSNFNKPVIAAAAIRNLGKTGISDFAETMIERLNEDDFDDDEEELRESIILLAGELEYSPAVPILIDILRDDSYSSVSRRFACDSLGRIGDIEAIPVLKEFLNDSDSILRSYVITSLAYFDGDEIEEILIQALRDSYWRIRVAACEALSERDSRNAVDILIYKSEKDPEGNVKKAAMKALGEIGGNKAWSFLAEYYGNNRNSDVFRSTALVSLLENEPGKLENAMKSVFEEEWEKENSWIFNFTCKALSTTESISLKWFYEKMLDHSNYIIRIYAVRGIRLNHIVSLYSRVEEISLDESQHRQLRKEAASLNGDE